MDRPIGKEVAELLRELVAIPSVNPAFCTPDDDREIFGEQKMARFLGDYFEQIGCKVWFDEILPGRANLIAHLATGKSGRSIALQAHLDTVQVTGMTVAPWGRQDGDRLFGRGSCDTKASIAAFASAGCWAPSAGGSPGGTTCTSVFSPGWIATLRNSTHS